MDDLIIWLLLAKNGQWWSQAWLMSVLNGIGLSTDIMVITMAYN